MKRFGTDLVSLASIFGGAVVGIAVTAAFLGGAEPGQARCGVRATPTSPQIVVTRGEGSHAIVMSAPDVRVHTEYDCVTDVDAEVTVHLEEVRHELEETRVHLEMQRLEMLEAAGMIVRIKETGAELDDTGAQLDEVRVIMEKVEKGSGGQME
jgi:hypothetical protein